MGVIKVLGQGKVMFTPDVTRVTVGIESLHSTYKYAFDSGVRNTNHIKDILAEHNLDGELAKTSRFDVKKHRVYKKKVELNEWQWLDEGYELNQTFIIDLEMGCPQLTSLLNQIGSELIGAEIEFGFAVSDSESAQLKVIEVAVKDAQRKAEVMANALGKKLGEVSSVNYGVSRDNYYDGRVYESASPCGGFLDDSTSIDITPVDLQGYGNVEVVWELR